MERDSERALDWIRRETIVIEPLASEMAILGWYHIEHWCLVWYYLISMDTVQKVTVEIPRELLDKAQKASGTGITQTVRIGLQLVAASRTYTRLRQFRGQVRFGRTLAELKADR